MFLPGQEDIESLQQLLLEHLPTLKKAGNETNKPLLGSNKVSIVSKSNPEIVTTTTKDEDGSLVVSVEDVKDYEIRPLYAAMPPEEQLKVFEPSKEGVRKFILSTNIAETSVTISGVKYGK